MGFAARDILKAGTPIAVAAVTLIPVVRTRVWIAPIQERLSGNATSDLSALIVRETAGDRVIDCEGERTLEMLRQTVDGLARALDAVNG